MFRTARRRASRAARPETPSGSSTAALRYSANGISARARCAPRAPRSRRSSRSAAAPAAAIGAVPSNGRPDACASRWRTVEPGRPGRLVEVDDTLLGRDQRRERGDRLRDRRPAELARLVPVPGARCRPARRPRPRRARRGHASTCRQRLHARAILDAWSAASSPPARRTSRSSASRARCVVGTHVLVAGTAPVMPDGDEPPDDAVRAGPPLPRDHRRRARRGRRSARGRRAHAHLPHERRLRSKASPGRTARSSARSARRSTAVVTKLLDRRWLVEIEAEAGGRVKQIYPATITGKSFAPGGSVLEHKFGQGDPYTLGVEEEYMLLDERDVRPRPAHRHGARRRVAATSSRTASTRS